jgi:hypothetical protein
MRNELEVLHLVLFETVQDITNMSCCEKTLLVFAQVQGMQETEVGPAEVGFDW